MRALKIITGLGLFVLFLVVMVNGPRQRAPRYNAATEVKVQGVVQEVSEYWCPINADKGAHLMLKTEAGILEVHLAPVRFLRGNGLTFNKGDQIEVVGSMVTYQGHDALIARKITRDNRTVAVRQPNGKPIWVE